MDLHTAAFWHADGRGANTSNPWEVASNDPWGPWFSISKSVDTIGNHYAKNNLTEGLVTTFFNREHWTLRNGQTTRVYFDRDLYLRLGGVAP